MEGLRVFAGGDCLQFIININPFSAVKWLMSFIEKSTVWVKKDREMQFNACFENCGNRITATVILMGEFLIFW